MRFSPCPAPRAFAFWLLAIEFFLSSAAQIFIICQISTASGKSTAIFTSSVTSAKSHISSIVKVGVGHGIGKWRAIVTKYAADLGITISAEQKADVYKFYEKNQHEVSIVRKSLRNYVRDTPFEVQSTWSTVNDAVEGPPRMPAPSTASCCIRPPRKKKHSKMLTRYFRSCNVCRRRKLKCNRETPCSNCLKSRTREACVYEDEQPRPRRPRRPPNQDQAGHSSTSATSITAGLAGVDATEGTVPTVLPSLLANRNRQVEDDSRKLSTPATRTHSSSYANASTPASEIETATTQLSGTYHIHHQPAGPAIERCEPSRLPSFSRVHEHLSGGAPNMARNVSHKTRLFGQSHWFNTMAPLVRAPGSTPTVECVPKADIIWTLPR